MFRRSRFSARPNVGTVGRGAAAATPQEAPPAKQEASETPTDSSENNTATSAVVENKSDVTSEKAAAPEDGNDQNGEGTSSAAAIQRRKRFSVKPKVAPGRPATLSRTPKSSVKAISDTPVESPSSFVETSLQTISTRSGNTATTQGLQSPRRRRSSEGSKSPRVQPKPALVPSDGSEPAVVPPAEDSPEQTHLPSTSSGQSENASDCQVKEVPPVRLPEKVPPSLPDREATEISEKARTLASSKTALSLTASAYSLSRLLNGPSDLQRLVKAQKLRELLKQERWKEKTLKKAKARSKEYSLDPTKMTMRDLIHYLPTSNPMSYDLEDSMQENETVLPSSPVREAFPELAREPEAPPNNTTNSVEEEEEGEEGEDDQDDALMVPQVKVAEDGSLIIDEESLTVEVQRAKGPNPAQDRDPIFERGSTTTYSSFRKGTYTKPWSSEETDMFFLAVSMVGTDFSMICQLFPHRARSEIKNKFKKEERLNAWRIDKAFKERRKLDIEYFSKLLEKILEVQKNRKKLKSLAEKNAPKQRKRKAAAKKPARRLSNVEEVDEEDEDEVPDLEEEGEKENEDLCNEEDAPPAAEPKRKNKRNKKTDAATEEPHGKKSKAGNKSTEQDEAGAPEDAEVALPEDHTNSDTTQDAVTDKNPVIKPAKLSRARAPKPTLPLGRKWGKKTEPSTKPNDSVSEEEDVDVDALEEQVDNDASTSSEANKRKTADVDVSDEEEDTPVKPLRPTRYGRVPKPTRPLTYSDKDDAHSSASETSAGPASAAKPKPKCTAKRGRPSKQPSSSKKPKLVTLQASRSEFSDDEYEEVDGQQQPSTSRTDDGASAFVPTGLHTLQPEISEVDESMEELDILASMPDVLGISQEALCPESSCEQAQHETDTAEPYEHQLDLLVDVIDFLSAEHTEVSEEQSYNEAAQTLLTIGNLAHIAQSAQNQESAEDPKEGTSTDDNKPSSIEEQIASRAAIDEESASVSAQCDQDVTTSETATAVEVKATETHAGGGDMAVTRTSVQEHAEQKTVIELEPEPESSNKNPPQTSKGRLSREKPNLARISRAAQSKSQPEESPSEASHAVAPDVCQANAVIMAAREIVPETQDFAPTTFKVILIEEPSCQETIAAVSVQTSSEIQSHLSTESKFEPSWLTVSDVNVTSESTDEKLASSVESSETSLKDPVTCDSTLTVVDQETVTDLPIDEASSDKSTHDVPHVEDSAARKGEESEVETTCHSRRSRLQKIKPKLPQTSRTARSEAQTTKESKETELTSELIKENLTPCSQTSETVPGPPDPQPAQKQEDHESVVVTTPAEVVPPTQEECTVSTSQMRRGRIQRVKPNVSQTARTEKSKPQCRKDLNVSPELDVELQPTEKLSQSTDLASTVYPLFNEGSTPKEPTPNEDKHTRPEPPNRVDLILSPSEEKTSENKNLSMEQNIGELVSTSKVSDEILSAQVQTADVSCGNVLITHSSVTESKVGQHSNVHSASVQCQTGQEDHPALAATCVKDSPASQEESQASSSSQGRSGRLQRIKPEPILPQTSRTRRSKCQTSNEPVEKESSLSTKIEVEQQQNCPRSPEKSHSTPPALTVVSAVEQVTRDPPLTSVITKDNPVSHVESGESGINDMVTSDLADPESRIGQGSNVHSTPVQVLKLSSPVRKSRLQKIKPKPNLSQTRTVKNKPEPNEPPVSREQPLEEKSIPTLGAETTDNKKAEVEMQSICSSSLQETSTQSESTGIYVSECIPSAKQKTKEDVHGLALSSEGMVQNASLGRQLSKVNLQLSTRTAQTQSPNVSQPLDHSLKDISSSVTTEQPLSDTNKAHRDLELVEKNDEHLPPEHSLSKEEHTTVKIDQGDCELDTSAGTAEPKSQQIIDPAADPSKDASTGSTALSTDASSVYLEGNSTVECTDDVKSELTDSSQTSKKAPQARRGRLIKPKPALGCSSIRRRQAQEAKDTNPTEPESGGSSMGVDDSDHHKRVPEPRPDAQEPVVGVNDESLHQDPPPKDIEPSHGSLAQSAHPPHRGAETLSSKVAPSSTEEIQSHPILQDLLPDNVPSDPNEPFFILSLTEIPVPSLGEAANSAAHPPSHRTVKDTSRQQPGVSGESVSVTAGGPSSFNVVISTEESADKGRSDVKDKESDAAASNEPESSQGSISVEPQECSQTAESDEAAMTPAKEKPTGAGRRAKSQVKPIVTKKRQTRKALNPNEPESAPSPAAQDSEHAVTSLQLRALDQDITEVQKWSSRDVDNESQREADISSSAHTTQRTGTCRKTRAKAKAAPTISPPPSKAASKGSKAKTPPAKRKQSSPEPAATTSHDVVSTRQPKEIHAPTITSPTETEEPQISRRRTAEVSDSQRRANLTSSFLGDQEPLSVSQYFLSDIFTDVEDE